MPPIKKKNNASPFGDGNQSPKEIGNVEDSITREEIEALFKTWSKKDTARLLNSIRDSAFGLVRVYQGIRRGDSAGKAIYILRESVCEECDCKKCEALRKEKPEDLIAYELPPNPISQRILVEHKFGKATRSEEKKAAVNIRILSAIPRYEEDIKRPEILVQDQTKTTWCGKPAKTAKKKMQPELSEQQAEEIDDILDMFDQEPALDNEAINLPTN